MTQLSPKNVDEYVNNFPPEIRTLLQQIRTTVKNAAPGSEEKISYGMPTFILGGKYLIYFAAYKNHIGVYPVPGGVKEFEEDFARYKTSGRGTIQFPLNKPLPLDLISRIVKYRAGELQ